MGCGWMVVRQERGIWPLLLPLGGFSVGGKRENQEARGKVCRRRAGGNYRTKSYDIWVVGIG